jgi:hypothetical protein
MHTSKLYFGVVTSLILATAVTTAVAKENQVTLNFVISKTIEQKVGGKVDVQLYASPTATLTTIPRNDASFTISLPSQGFSKTVNYVSYYQTDADIPIFLSMTYTYQDGTRYTQYSNKCFRSGSHTFYYNPEGKGEDKPDLIGMSDSMPTEGCDNNNSQSK